MVSWAITGATRGIGFGFVKNLSMDPNNQMFALIWSLGTAGPLEELAAQRKNIHIIVTDISDPTKLDEAAAEVSKVTVGSLDVLVLNAGSTGPGTAFRLLTRRSHGKKEALDLEIGENIKINLLSNIYTMNSFLHLIRNGAEKKIIFISSQNGNLEFTRIIRSSTFLGYSVSKAGMNMVVAKFAIELAPEGIKTLALSPGWVNTDAVKAVTGDPEILKGTLDMLHKVGLKVEGPAPIEEAVANMLRVIPNLAEADSGKLLTHHGNEEQWY
ncbi:hypothetical protein GQ44DRAFT_656770 [Phaeosphaeriaceae sp. PMI808]|nr:hypothetical protein GQ44DRAFT_656770 [Phaeosphaeriaceae sp. PMI808]